VWKHWEHRNNVPLLGITLNPLRPISEWMPGGDLTEYIEKYTGADRLSLASTPSIVVFYPTLNPATSYLMSLIAFSFSTPATQPMESHGERLHQAPTSSSHLPLSPWSKIVFIRTNDCPAPRIYVPFKRKAWTWKNPLEPIETSPKSLTYRAWAVGAVG